MEPIPEVPVLAEPVKRITYLNLKDEETVIYLLSLAVLVSPEMATKFNALGLTTSQGVNDWKREVFRRAFVRDNERQQFIEDCKEQPTLYAEILDLWWVSSMMKG